MQLSDFDFDLPEGLIATRPVSPRRSARMLVAGPDRMIDATAADLPRFLRPGDLLVLNDTRVIPARLTGTRTREGAQGGSGVATVEVTLLEPRGEGRWSALVKPLKRVREGEVVVFSPDLSATLLAKENGEALFAFSATGDAFDAALAEAGQMPLPPYIAARRAADAQDKTDYQTVFARHPGAVAAPTASLHFDEVLLAALAERGVSFAHVTLHVGAGTFLPVKVEDIDSHKMHAEWGRVTDAAAAAIRAAKAEGRRVIPVGTTALRLVESAATAPGEIEAWEGFTDIFIRPGYDFRIADGLMTNFHLPKSTLMMLVSALMGRDRIMDIYDHAITQGYRFFSYGDASLLLPSGPLEPK